MVIFLKAYSTAILAGKGLICYSLCVCVVEAQLNSTVRTHAWALDLMGAYVFKAKTDTISGCPQSIDINAIQDETPAAAGEDTSLEYAKVLHNNMSANGINCTSTGTLHLMQSVDDQGNLLIYGADDAIRVCGPVLVNGATTILFDLPSNMDQLVSSGRFPKGALANTRPGEIYMGYTDSGAAIPWGCWYQLIATKQFKPSPSPSVSNVTVKKQSSACFPGRATVMLENNSIIRMEELEVGHRVHVGQGLYSDVFMFTHRCSQSYWQFHVIKTTSGHELTVTGDHFLYRDDMKLVSAGSLRKGDSLMLDDGNVSIIRSVSCAWMYGLYNPHTLHGDIAVDGLRTSTYTSVLAPSFAHSILAVFRTLYRLMNLDPSAGVFETGLPLHISDKMVP
jgi:Hint module